MDALFSFYPLLSLGGFIMFDDMMVRNARTATTTVRLTSLLVRSLVTDPRCS